MYKLLFSSSNSGSGSSSGSSSGKLHSKVFSLLRSDAEEKCVVAESTSSF